MISPTDQPLTFNQFFEFYQKNIEPYLLEIPCLRQDMLGHYDHLYKKVGDLEQEYIVICGQLKRMDERFEEIDQRFDNIDQRFDEIELRLEASESLNNKIKAQLDAISKKIEPSEDERRSIAFDLKVLKSLCNNLEGRIEKLERDLPKS